MRKAVSSRAVSDENLPMLKTVGQMSRVSGIGENKLRRLMETRELEYIQIGNRRLLMDSFIIDWVRRTRIPPSDSDFDSDSEED